MVAVRDEGHLTNSTDTVDDLYSFEVPEVLRLVEDISYCVKGWLHALDEDSKETKFAWVMI